MSEEDFKYTHARIVPTVIVLIVIFLLFGFTLGYNLGFAHGRAESIAPLQKCPNIPLSSPPIKKPLIMPPPIDSSNLLYL